MSRYSPSSSGEPGVGRSLLAFSLGAAVGVATGNLAPPALAWTGVLGVLTLAACWRGAVRHPEGAGWWLGVGLLGGLTACALAPRAPVGVREPVPARVTATVRDGWRSTAFGRETRVRVRSVESGQARLRVPSELRLTVSGAPSVAELPVSGSLIEVAGDLDFDPSWPLARPRLRCKNPRLITPMVGGSAVDTLRQRLVQRLEQAAGVDPGRIRAAGLAAALVLGRRELLGEGDVARLRQGGLAHLLAVSGLHVGMVAAIGWLVLLSFGVPPYWRRWAVVLGLVVFAGLAGGAAPVRRAALAGVLYLVARQVGRPLVPFPTVAGVVAVLLLVEPAAALEVSFQLSAVVTLVLVRWAGPLAGALRWPLGRAAPAVSVAAVAQAASMPLVGYHFGSVPWLGVIANLVAVPVGFAAVSVSVAAATASLLSAELVAPLLTLLDWLRRGLSAIGQAATIGSAPYPASATLLLVVVVLGLGSLVRRRRGWVLGAAAVAVGVAGPWAAHAPRRGQGELQALGVGVGSAVLLRWGDSAILVDGGERPGEAVRELRRVGVDRLQALVVTHPDSDHAGGVAAVLDAVRVDRLLYPHAVASRPELVDLRRRARGVGVPEEGLVRGQRLDLGGIVCDVLWPGHAAPGDDNDRSLVAACQLGPVRVLIPGDLETAGEYALLDAGPSALAADVLVLGHHGSATSSTPAFLARVAPRVAVAATGTTPRYPYPAERVVRRLHARHVVLVTQRQGISRLWWDASGEVTVGTRYEVAVGRRRGGEA